MMGDRTRTRWAAYPFAAKGPWHPHPVPAHLGQPRKWFGVVADDLAELDHVLGDRRPVSRTGAAFVNVLHRQDGARATWPRTMLGGGYGQSHEGQIVHLHPFIEAGCGLQHPSNGHEKCFVWEPRSGSFSFFPADPAAQRVGGAEAGGRATFGAYGDAGRSDLGFAAASCARRARSATSAAGTMTAA